MTDRLIGKRDRNTPTSVGKTFLYLCSFSRIQKHPHERGEDYTVDMATL